MLLLLFAASGCAALIYEVVWFHLLRLVIGASAISLGMLLASFMGGMCAGSLAFGRFVSTGRHPLRVYAVIELSIGVIGLFLPLVLPAVSEFYAASMTAGKSGVAVRAVVSAVCLLPPTILMGATLPAIGRWVESTAQGMSRLGYFYGANIVGAVVGCLAAGFYLLPHFDMMTASYVAVGLNVAVALIALVISWRSPYQPESYADTARVMRFSPSAVHAAIALSGLTALGAEVVWTRLLSLLLGVTVYAFSIILAVFLAGLGLGSSIGSALICRIKRPAVALAFCQLMLVGAIWYAAMMLTRVIPYWQPPEVSADGSMFPSFAFDGLRCLIALLPASMLWGASFPLAMASSNFGGSDPGRTVGGLYAANTAGAIAGSLLFTLIAVPAWGISGAHSALCVISGFVAMLMFWNAWSERTAGETQPVEGASVREFQHWVRWPLATGATLLAVAVAATTIPTVPVTLYAIGRKISWPQYKPFSASSGRPLYLEDGVTTPVLVWQRGGYRSLRLSGKSVASDHPFDMWLQRSLGHLPALVHEHPRSALIVGMGAGVTAGSFVVHPEIEQIVICEIEPRVSDAAGEYFAEANHQILSDPRTTVVFDDGRHFLATTPQKFDIITSDPLHPYVRGAASLYSLEYYELCKRHLNAGGVVTQWIPLYETNEAAVKSQLATFLKAFPHGTLWHANLSGKGYDIVALGQVEPTRLDVAAVEARLKQNPRLQESLSAVLMGSIAEILDAFTVRGSDLEPWLASAEINRDSNLRLEYLAGRSLDIASATHIFHAMLKYRNYPRDILVASEPVHREMQKRFQETEFPITPLPPKAQR